MNKEVKIRHDKQLKITDKETIKERNLLIKHIYFINIYTYTFYKHIY